MSTATPDRTDSVIDAGSGHVPTDSIRIVTGHNHRVIDQEADDFKGLVESLRAMGILVPLIVAAQDAPHGFDWELIAGERRLLAARAAGLDSVPVVVRDAATAQADAAVENMNRTDLWPLEEANAIKAMIDNGYTEAGAAQLLGISKRLVTDRLSLFKLPEATRAYFGPGEKTADGHAPVSMVKSLLPIAEKSPELCDAVMEFAYDQRRWRIDGWVINNAIEDGKLKVFIEYMTRLDEHDLADGGPKKLRDLYAQVSKARGSMNYLAPLHFSDEDVDQARALGVLLELPDCQPMILDKKVHKQLREAALKRELPLQLQRLKDAKMAASSQAGKAKKDANGDPIPLTEEQVREQAYRAIAKGWPDSAHSVNHELGAALMMNVASLPVDMNVARFFVYGMLGVGASFNGDGKYLNTGSGTSQHAVQLARSGMRLCLGELVTVTPTTLKSGKPGKTKVVYATDEACEKWLWKFLNGAKTPEELFGRAIALYAASEYAVQEAVPGSDRGFRCVRGGQKGAARKAFDALTKSHVPASVKKLRAAMARAEKDRRPPEPVRPDVPAGEWVGDDVEDLDDE